MPAPVVTQHHRRGLGNAELPLALGHGPESFQADANCQVWARKIAPK